MSNEMKTSRRTESNEVARKLTWAQLAERALVSGLYFGFNGAEVVQFIDSESLEPVIEVMWGDQRWMRQPRMRTPQVWAIAYSEEEPCTCAGYRRLQLSAEALSESCEALDRRFTAALLELAQDSAVRDEPVSQKVAPQ